MPPPAERDDESGWGKVRVAVAQGPSSTAARPRTAGSGGRRRASVTRRRQEGGGGQQHQGRLRCRCQGVGRAAGSQRRGCPHGVDKTVPVGGQRRGWGIRRSCPVTLWGETLRQQVQTVRGVKQGMGAERHVWVCHCVRQRHPLARCPRAPAAAPPGPCYSSPTAPPAAHTARTAGRRNTSTVRASPPPLLRAAAATPGAVQLLQPVQPPSSQSLGPTRSAGSGQQPVGLQLRGSQAGTACRGGRT